jgi:hypothetical protein
MLAPMIPFTTLRRNPYFAPMFAQVCPLLWPVLWWSLNRFLRWYQTCPWQDILFEPTPWGFIRIVHFGDRKGAWTPYVPTQPRWDDPVWSTNVPTPLLTLAASETLRLIPILPRAAGGGGWSRRGQTEGACNLTSIPDTS